jgi:hypothetical protein
MALKQERTINRYVVFDRLDHLFQNKVSEEEVWHK